MRTRKYPEVLERKPYLRTREGGCRSGHAAAQQKRCTTVETTKRQPTQVSVFIAVPAIGGVRTDLFKNAKLADGNERYERSSSSREPPK